MKIYIRIFLLVFLAGLWAGFFPFGKSVKKEAAVAKPNIIIVLADQWRYDAVGYAGNKDVKTPNLDKLAKESVVFETAVVVTPVCSPSRASLLTGQYPLTHGVFYNDKPLRNESLTLAEIYNTAGYKTGYIGKWHLNGHPANQTGYSSRNLPVPASRRQGFDYWKAREVTHNYNESFYFDEQDRKHNWKGYDAFPQTDSAIAFIQKVNKSKNPFLLFLSWGPPHDPYQTAPEEYFKLYDAATLTLKPNVPIGDQEKARKALAGYYAHCTALDKAMGDLIAALDKEGVADNTILLFTSDHGDMLYTKGMVKKQKPWDESIRVPMLMRYPAKLGKAQKKVTQPINMPDVLPTLLGLTNIKIPATVQGIDFSAALLGKKKFENEATLIQLPVPFHEWNFNSGGREYRGVRTERYTYVRDLQKPWLLYDNKTDPHQQHNLVGQPAYAKLQKELDQTLTKKLNQLGDKFLPADEYMKQWQYRYDFKDSLRAANYLAN